VSGAGSVSERRRPSAAESHAGARGTGPEAAIRARPRAQAVTRPGGAVVSRAFVPAGHRIRRAGRRS
ncbi:hypothetical protein ACFWFU_41190, partial [Streptomyces sp. NPDC060235]|uniref:hypothetical protein n=1 Tax=Streptomyces sp. NPDC060235 TaxID=3347080 RepID=UPI003667506C